MIVFLKCSGFLLFIAYLFYVALPLLLGTVEQLVGLVNGDEP